MSILRATCLALAIVAPVRAATVAAVFDGRIPCVAADGGVHAGVPTLPLDPGAVTAQLVSSGGQCWGASFSSAKKNTARLWKGVLR